MYLPRRHWRSWVGHPKKVIRKAAYSIEAKSRLRRLLRRNGFFRYDDCMNKMTLINFIEVKGFNKHNVSFAAAGCYNKKRI